MNIYISTERWNVYFKVIVPYRELYIYNTMHALVGEKKFFVLQREKWPWAMKHVSFSLQKKKNAKFHQHIYIYIGLISRVFANGPGDRG